MTETRPAKPADPHASHLPTASASTGPAEASKPAKPFDPRSAALRRFALSISVFTILGHTLLGFEQAYMTPVVAILTAYLLETVLETADAAAAGRRPRFLGVPAGQLVDFYLPAHITGLACAMLLYGNNRLTPTICAVTIAVASKYLIRIRIGGRLKHVLNPSNGGIVAVLLLFPWVGIAPPYQFTEYLPDSLDWLVPAVILVGGTLINGKLTRKMPLIAAWVGGFVLQAVVRGGLTDISMISALLPITGAAFVLFTNYMITDPATTPWRWRGQVAFGLTTAAAYGVLVSLHIVYGLFFALVATCVLRGTGLVVLERQKQRQRRVQAATAAPPAAPAPAADRPAADQPVLDSEPVGSVGRAQR